MISEERLLAKKLIEKIVEKTNKGKIPWEVKGKPYSSNGFGTYHHPYVARCNGVNLRLWRDNESSRFCSLKISKGKRNTTFRSGDQLYSKTLETLFETVDNLIRKPWEEERTERQQAKRKTLIDQLDRALD